MRTSVLAVILALVIVPSVTGQTLDRSAGDLSRHLVPGDRVFVTTRDSGEYEGAVERLTPTSVVVRSGGRSREFVLGEVAWLERYPDPVWDDARKAAIVGYAGTLGQGYFICRTLGGGGRGECANFLTDGLLQRYAITSAGVWSAIALVVDASMSERWLVYGTRPASARGQLRAPDAVGSLDELWSRVRPGDTVYVRDADGQDIPGLFARASASGVTVTIDGSAKEIAAGDVRQVRRRTGRTGQGMLFGALAGATIGALVPPDYGSRGGSAFAGGLVGWALGAIVGPLVPSRPLVYDARAGHLTTVAAKAPSLVVRPLVGPDGRGIVLSIRF